MIILVSAGGGGGGGDDGVCNSVLCVSSGLSVFQVQKIGGAGDRFGWEEGRVQRGEAPGRTALDLRALNSLQLLENTH